MTDHEGWSVLDLALWREYCEQIADNEPPMSDSDTVQPSWRDLPPTFKQEKLLRKFGQEKLLRKFGKTVLPREVKPQT